MPSEVHAVDVELPEELLLEPPSEGLAAWAVDQVRAQGWEIVGDEVVFTMVRASALGPYTSVRVESSMRREEI